MRFRLSVLAASFTIISQVAAQAPQTATGKATVARALDRLLQAGARRDYRTLVSFSNWYRNTLSERQASAPHADWPAIKEQLLAEGETQFTKFASWSELETLAVAEGFPHRLEVLELRRGTGRSPLSGEVVTDAFVRITYNDVAASPFDYVSRDGTNRDLLAIKQVTYRIGLAGDGTAVAYVEPSANSSSYWPQVPPRVVGVRWMADGFIGLRLHAMVIGMTGPATIALKCGEYGPQTASAVPITNQIVELIALPYAETSFPMTCTVVVRDASGHTDGGAFVSKLMFTGTGGSYCWTRAPYYRAGALASSTPGRCSRQFGPVELLSDLPSDAASAVLAGVSTGTTAGTAGGAAVSPHISPSPTEVGRPAVVPDSLRGAFSAMMTAIGAGDTARVKQLAVRKLLINGVDSAFVTPLMAAAQSGRSDIVRILLSRGADPQLVSHGAFGDSYGPGASALSFAVAGGFTQIVQLLMGAGANPNGLGTYDGSLLADAMYGHNDSILQILYRAGAKLEPLPENLVAAAAGGYVEPVRSLLASGVNVNTGAGYKGSSTALMAAASSGDIGIVKLLLAAGAKLEPSDDAAGLTALGQAASKGHLDLVRYLIGAGAKLTGGGDYYPIPPLHAAAAAGQAEVVRVLIEAGANPAETQQGRTALDLARAGKHQDVVQILEAAQAYLQGYQYYERGEYAKAADLFKQAAEQGNAVAAGTLGFMYMKGSGVPVDIPKAISNLTVSFDAGEPSAAYNLGDIYYYGKGGIKKDRTLASQWYAKALAGHLERAASGDLESITIVGRMYSEGAGTKPNPTEALKWLQQAVDRGYPMAQRILGDLNVQGIGMPKNRPEGVRLLRLAAQSGDKSAQGLLQTLGETW